MTLNHKGAFIMIEMKKIENKINQLIGMQLFDRWIITSIEPICSQCHHNELYIKINVLDTKDTKNTTYSRIIDKINGHYICFSMKDSDDYLYIILTSAMSKNGNCIYYDLQA